MDWDWIATAGFIGLVFAITVIGIVLTNDDAPTPEELEDPYTFCIAHGGSFISHGIGEGFECLLPSSSPSPGM